MEAGQIHGKKRPREDGQSSHPSKKLHYSVPLTPLSTHKTSWTPSEAKVTLNATLDRTILDDGDIRSCNLLVVDNFFGEAERSEMMKCLVGEDGLKLQEDGDAGAKIPPLSKWERSTADGKDMPTTYGPNSEVLEELMSGNSRAVREIWSRLCLMYPHYHVCLQPHNKYFVQDEKSTPNHVCYPVVGNAPIPGDQFRYHYDGDPESFPPSAWTRQYGNYVNHEPGKPLFVSALFYLCKHWRRDFLGETLFLDDGTETGIFVRPRQYRMVLMDQDCLHRICAPSNIATTPRYSIVFKLVFLAKSPNVVPSIATGHASLFQRDIPTPNPFGSTAKPIYGKRPYDHSRLEPPPHNRQNSNTSERSYSKQTPSPSPPYTPDTHSTSYSHRLEAREDSNGARGIPERLLTTKAPVIHAFVAKSQTFTVDQKYTPLNEIGQGAYGVVCPSPPTSPAPPPPPPRLPPPPPSSPPTAAIDTKTDTKVAIKKIPKVFDDLIDAKRVLREIKLLRHFKHENVVGLYDLIAPPSYDSFKDMYIVLNLMETDLHKIIHSRNELSDDHIQYFMYQILRGLKYIHSAGVMHRDLKPSNILLNGNCDLKICDFGLARGVEGTPEDNLTEYVVTRWYRAPEVMCSCREYNHKIDVWSVGCIMAELHGRKPLFPGKDYIQQMNLIFNLIGSPRPSDTSFITNGKALQYITTQMAKRDPVPLVRIYPKANPQAISLMTSMLKFNPNFRMSVSEALDHPYFKNLRVKETETLCEQPFEFVFEKMETTEQNIKESMFNEIALFRPYILKNRFARPPPPPHLHNRQSQLRAGNASDET
ncbi:hypothetical protein AAMO2058_001312800 [Amorphochlora amoebiformis]